MRHKNAGRQFGRDTSSRRAMLRNLTANLITHERIETTDTKAKELRRVAERLVTKATRLGKVAYSPQGDLTPAERARRLHVERLVSAFVPRFSVKADGSRVDIIEKVMVELSRRFEGRPGGYTRIIKLGTRRGDNAPMSLIEFVDAPAVGGGADLAEPDLPAEPAEPVTAAEPAEPVTAAEPAEPVTAAEPAEPVTAAEPAEPAKAEPADPASSAG